MLKNKPDFLKINALTKPVIHDTFFFSTKFHHHTEVCKSKYKICHECRLIFNFVFFDYYTKRARLIKNEKSVKNSVSFS